MNVKTFFFNIQKEQIISSIRNAEKQTSGEIRVHLEMTCMGDPLERAKRIFYKLKMHKTKMRNGTLIYLALKNQKFAIYGDKGINDVVPENFWQDVKEAMHTHFSGGDFIDGIDLGIHRIGQKLKELFPYQDDDFNELPDDISIGR
jgi:uncharacterized membrane protein